MNANKRKIDYEKYMNKLKNDEERYTKFLEKARNKQRIKFNELYGTDEYIKKKDADLIRYYLKKTDEDLNKSLKNLKRRNIEKYEKIINNEKIKEKLEI